MKLWAWAECLRTVQGLGFKAQSVLSTNIGNTYPNHKGSYYYGNHTLYHIGTLDPLGGLRFRADDSELERAHP